MAQPISAEVAPVQAKSAREHRLDLFRGLALAMMFIDHIWGTIYANYTLQAFGFTSAAENLVLISGMSAGLAYTAAFQSGGFVHGAGRILRRLWTIYLAHLTVVSLAVAIALFSGLWLGLGGALELWDLSWILVRPADFVIGTVTLTVHQIYGDILPLFVGLLALALAFVPLAIRWPALALGASILLWLVACHFQINLPRQEGMGWTFNPFAWQLLFVIGLLAGIAMRRGRTFLGWRPFLFWACVIFVVVAFLVDVDPQRRLFGDWLYQSLAAEGAPEYLIGFDRTFLGLPIILHTLALAYVVSQVPLITRLAGSAAALPLRLLGRHALPVFVTATAIDFLLIAIRHATGFSALTDAVAIGLGLGAMLTAAIIADRLSPKGRSAGLAATLPQKEKQGQSPA